MDLDLPAILHALGWTAVGAVALVVAGSAFGTLREYERAVVFRLGRYDRTAGPGLYFVAPLLERVQIVDLRIVTREIAQQDAITRDNVPLTMEAVVWTRAVDPKKSVIEVVDADAAIDQYAATALRAVIGRHPLDEVLKDQEAIAGLLKAKIDAITEPWGLKVEQVEIKNIELPENMERAMAQEAEATREKKARVIKAEGEEEASKILSRAADNIAGSPGGLQLRQLQTISEVGAENNTTVIMMLPVEMLQGLGGLASLGGAARPAPSGPGGAKGPAAEAA